MNPTSPQVSKPQKTEEDLRNNLSGDFSDFKKETREIDIVRELIKQDQLTKPDSGIFIPDINHYKI